MCPHKNATKRPCQSFLNAMEFNVCSFPDTGIRAQDEGKVQRLRGTKSYPEVLASQSPCSSFSCSQIQKGPKMLASVCQDDRNWFCTLPNVHFLKQILSGRASVEAEKNWAFHACDLLFSP